MILKIVSSILILFVAFMSVKHGLPGLTGNVKPEEATMMNSIGINRQGLFGIHLLSLAVGGLILFP